MVLHDEWGKMREVEKMLKKNVEGIATVIEGL